MYTDDEIKTIARNCTTADEVMAATKAFRELIKDGLQEATEFLTYTFIKRFREVM